MARLFAILFLLFIGGSGIAALVTGSAWPIICAMAALYVLVKVFAACDRAGPEYQAGPPALYRGRPDRRMPS